MADTKTVTQELLDANLDLSETMKDMSGSDNYGDQLPFYNIIIKLIEKIDELTAEVNTLKNE